MSHEQQDTVMTKLDKPDSTPSTKEKKYGKTISFFKKDAACTIQYTETRSSKPYKTISIEVCRSSNFEATWSTKEIRQVSKAELLDVCACLLGFKPRIDGKFHGDSNNRSYHLLRSRDGVNVSLFAAGEEARYINLSNADAFHFAKFAVGRLIQNHDDGFDARDTINLIQATYMPRFTN